MKERMAKTDREKYISSLDFLTRTNYYLKG